MDPLRLFIDTVRAPAATLITIAIPPCVRSSTKVLVPLQEQFEALRCPHDADPTLAETAEVQRRVVSDAMSVIGLEVEFPVPSHGLLCFVGRIGNRSVKIVVEPDEPLDTSLMVMDTRFHYVGV
jgi:hypothetical protein